MPKRERCLLLARGTGAQGLRELRPSESGAFGPGIYFYAGPAIFKARSYAERGGGVIVAVASADRVEYHRIEDKGGGGFFPERQDVAVVRDPADVRIIGVVPTDQTLDYADFQRAVEKLARKASKSC